MHHITNSLSICLSPGLKWLQLNWGGDVQTGGQVSYPDIPCTATVKARPLWSFPRTTQQRSSDFLLKPDDFNGFQRVVLEATDS